MKLNRLISLFNTNMITFSNFLKIFSDWRYVKRYLLCANRKNLDQHVMQKLPFLYKQCVMPVKFKNVKQRL